MKILALACFIIITGFCGVFGSGGKITGAFGPDLTETFAARVTTPLGRIEGIMSDFRGLPVRKFLGIPYATPPLGSLRFLPPEPVKPWNDILQAKNQPPACMQLQDGPFPWYDDMDGKSEDCLYLNIYTPFYATNKRRLAVMFWIYGGGFTLGSNRMDVYDGSALAAREGIIVVTINYRLNLFGFLTSNSSDAPGNAGLYDLAEALKWVNDYIEYFGGDKKRITVAGESAGAIAAGMLCVSPLTEGLFSRAILQSSSVTSRISNSLGANLELAQNLAKVVKCADDVKTIQENPTEVVQCLREKDATVLSKGLKSIYPITTRTFNPQYGDTLLPNNGALEVKNGNIHNISVLSGVVHDEGSFLVTLVYPDQFGFFGQRDQIVNKTFATSVLQGVFGKLPEPEKYVDYYLKDVADDDYDLLRKQICTAWGDLRLFCPNAYFAEKVAEKGNDVYYYGFIHRPSNTPWAKWMGVVHFEEVQFVFGRPLRVPEDYTAEEVELSAQMMKLFANFVKDGHPGRLSPDSFFDWPKYSKEYPIVFHLGTTNFGVLAPGPHRENCNFLRDYYGY